MVSLSFFLPSCRHLCRVLCRWVFFAEIFLSTFLATFLATFLSTFLATFFWLFVKFLPDFLSTFCGLFIKNFCGVLCSVCQFEWVSSVSSEASQNGRLCHSYCTRSHTWTSEGVRLPNYIPTLQANPGGRNFQNSIDFNLIFSLREIG